ncbi:MAG: ATP synthase F1 subunit delta [Deltaproteobacteria bacterium]|nr:ATP synthase F1 subunit delta [Deltaproteobacteria bacterium]MBW2135983.1 ATP synthase F1 subunit delta [Deltaproteobacteria bacterium]
MISSKVSKRYARALFSLGQQDGNLERYGKDLREFSGFCREHGEFRNAITNRVFPLDERRHLLHLVLEKNSYSEVVKNFLNLLLEKDRIGAIEGITSYYERLMDDFSNIARAEVLIPRPLEEDLQEGLVKALESLTSKVIKLEVKEDKELVGGVVVRIGDLVLDGSVKAQLEGLKESLKRGE